MIPGQINRGSQLGEAIYNLAKQDDVNTIVEIGTWNGAGSTKCVVDGVIDSHVKKSFISIESSKTQYDLAIDNLKSYREYVELLHGRIIDVWDLAWLRGVTLGPEQQVWLWEDIVNYKTCPDVYEMLPKQIDLLILDGGEFSTVPEFLKLKNTYKYLVLDDTQALKTKEINRQLLTRGDHALVSSADERNGFSIFKKVLSNE